jgi:hypothetical protein
VREVECAGIQARFELAGNDAVRREDEVAAWHHNRHGGWVHLTAIEWRVAISDWRADGSA